MDEWFPQPAFPTYPAMPDGSWFEVIVWAFTAWIPYLFEVFTWLGAMAGWALWTAIHAVVTSVAGYLPDPPGWMADLASSVSWAVSSMSGMCNWVNMPGIGLALGIVGGAWLTGLIIRIVRVVASFMTLGGGMGG